MQYIENYVIATSFLPVYFGVVVFLAMWNQEWGLACLGLILWVRPIQNVTCNIKLYLLPQISNYLYYKCC